MPTSSKARPLFRRTAGALVAILSAFSLLAPAHAAPLGDAPAKFFNADPKIESTTLSVNQIATSVPSNVMFPKQDIEITFQFVNHTDKPIVADGVIQLTSYTTHTDPTDSFSRFFANAKVIDSEPVSINVPAKGFVNVKYTPKVPPQCAAYAAVIDLKGVGRLMGTTLIRVLPPTPGRVQFPAFALDINGWNCFEGTYDFFQRTGIKATRTEYGYADDPAGRERLADLTKGMWNHDITLMVTSAGGGLEQPMGMFRHWLNDKDQMNNDYAQDMAWMPQDDEKYQKWIEYVASTYGWPKGPVNAIELWNEPWEGNSISGWAADMIRYREIFVHMAQGIEAARKNAGVHVLIGGGCSSMNTEDKLFCDGKDTFLKWLDFNSVHYQPNAAWGPLIPEWANRKSEYGPVRDWDTESWVANSEEHVATFLAAARAQGLTRTAGVFHDNTYTTGDADVMDPAGNRKVKLFAPWANGVAIAAFQHFVGERMFKQILFKNGLPWVFEFSGLPVDGKAATNDEDNVLVVIGDIADLCGRDRYLFRTVYGVKQTQGVAAAKAALASCPASATDAERSELKRKVIYASILEGAQFSIKDPKGQFEAFDYMGNPIAHDGAVLNIPLNDSGYFLKGNGKAGSFAALVAAVKAARIDGLEPVEIKAHDMLAPIAAKPSIRLNITNILNRPITGKLTAKVSGLELQIPADSITIPAQTTKDVELQVTGGSTTPSNLYPLSATFDAGADGKVTHDENMRVNLIARKTITVDGDLKDWDGVLPQSAAPSDTANADLTEKAWRPFEKFDAKQSSGYASAYLAYDDQFFYFAAKIADDSPWEGGPRYATRDDDSYFYPAVSYLMQWNNGVASNPTEKKWPEGVRRYSYRRGPEIPSGANTDNVQIGFGVFEPGTNGVLANSAGTMPRYQAWKCTDYEYVFNPVSAKYGGGVEIFRLLAPGTPRKHFYPRELKAPVDGGPVENGKLVITHDGNTRIVEAAIPWSELPEVKKRIDAGQTVRFTYRVNDNKGPAYELDEQRSVSQINTYSLHDLWAAHWSTDTEFAAEKK